jgi:dolichol-phosphate mannosyltransferase
MRRRRLYSEAVRIRQDADTTAAQPRGERTSSGSAANDAAAEVAGGLAHDGAVHDEDVNNSAVDAEALGNDAADNDAVHSDASGDDAVDDNTAGGGEICVIMPTYNERENIGPTLAALFEWNPQVHVLVVDDASPDGTGEAAEAIAAGEPRLHVLHREGKNGLGPAYLAGFNWALKRGYATLCSMDMDGSHRAQDLHAMLRVMADNPHVALVIGSRRVPGGRTEGWSRHRNWISSAGSWYARTMLGLGVRDMTSGMRAYRARILRASDLRSVEANGYVFQIDMTRRVAAAGGSIVEVPIVFPERVRGRSKMGIGIVVEAMRRVTGWGLRRLFGRS